MCLYFVWFEEEVEDVYILEEFQKLSELPHCLVECPPHPPVCHLPSVPSLRFDSGNMHGGENCLTTFFWGSSWSQCSGHLGSLVTSACPVVFQNGILSLCKMMRCDALVREPELQSYSDRKNSFFLCVFFFCLIFRDCQP